MSRTAVIGDGPAGLSAALLLAKNDHDTIVFAQDGTLMHKAHLYNYLGVEDLSGSDFQNIARRQVAAVGADLREVEVLEVASADGGFTVRTDDGEETVDNLILAGGKAAGSFAEALGADRADGALTVDADGRTSVDGLYAAGHLVRPQRSQAIISAGDGAAAALDILSREAGKDVHDWDVPPQD
ncbi:MAG: thioredoxin reductase [Nitriliruptor sp.]|nr:MAG: thioredoxin reductase [Nitriliruptor sp.]